MEIKYFGGNCIKIITKKSTIVIDDDLNSHGKALATYKDIALYTSDQETNKKAYFSINGPGEYEVSEISITGIPTRSHMEEKENGFGNTMYRLIVGDFRIGIVGHAHPDLTEEQLESLGALDILIIPVGGSGYTLDSIAALNIIKEVEPKMAIPTHYDDKKTKYPVDQNVLDEFIKVSGVEDHEKVDSLKLKNAEFIGESTKIIFLNTN